MCIKYYRDVEWICNQDASEVILPVLNINDRITLTDGHSRALALCQLGVRVLTVDWDTEDIDYTAYEKCVDWCQDESIHRISDLEFRVIPLEQFEKLWISRCTQMHSELGTWNRKEMVNRMGIFIQMAGFLGIGKSTLAYQIS